MALRRWAWLWGPVVAALLAMVALLPPRVPTGAYPVLGIWPTVDLAYRPEYRPRVYAADLQDARRKQEARLHHAILVDSIIVAARGPHALRSDSAPITVVYEAPLTSDSARSWLRAATREIAVYPEAGPGGMPIVVALLSNPVRARGRSGGIYYWGVQQLFDQASAAGACVVAVSLFRPGTMRLAVGHDASGKVVSRVLGTCALYGRFGAPGPGVARWALEDAGDWYWWEPLTVELRDARRPVRRWEVEHDQRIGGSPTVGEVRWLEIGCLHGSASACARTAGLASVPEDAFQVIYVGAASRRGRLIAHLLATGTPAQFAAFWRSSQPVSGALASAYGVPAGDLALAALRHWYAVPPVGGPRADPRTVLLGLGWAVLALAIALAAGRRRKSEI